MLQFAQKTSLILRISSNLTLTNICSCNTAKTLSDFTNFPANMFLFGIRNNIYTASFLDVHEWHSWNTLKVNACIFLYISLKKCLFQRHSKILSGEGWVTGRLKNFLGAIQKVCQLHNGIFRLIQICHTVSFTLSFPLC